MAKRTDANQRAIIAHLRSVPGVSVFSAHDVGRNFPDLVIGHRGRNYLIELKTEAGKLTKGQTEWHETWRGQVDVARDSEEILRIIGVI